MTAALESSILAKVIAAIQQMAFLRNSHQITAETRFAEDLGLDSLDVMEIILRIEEVFDTEFSPEVIAGFRGVPDVVRYLSCRFFPEAAESDLVEAA